MRFAWVGFHVEGVPALEALLADNAPIREVLTLTPELAARRSGGADYRDVCDRFGVPLRFIPDINGPQARQILADLAPDVVFVIGWHQIVRPDALRLARTGMIGAHASLLPHNRGSAPINWALINGEAQTGNSLIWLAPDVDAGDIIDQTPIPITAYDTCATLYRQVAETNREMLQRLLPRLLAGQRPGRPQVTTDEAVLRRRRPTDGLVDWNAASRVIYGFIRGLARPYPGAFSTLDGTLWRIWDASLPPLASAGPAMPGEVLGPVVSPRAEACGQAVACGRGSLILLEIESEDGTVLSGRALSEQRWAGRRWGND